MAAIESAGKCRERFEYAVAERGQNVQPVLLGSFYDRVELAGAVCTQRVGS